MITNYYTLAALVGTWAPDLTGCRLEDAFSQARDELTLAFADAAREWMLRLSVAPAFPFVFRSEGYSKARRNVATLFEEALGRTVTGLRLAERDRLLYLDLEGGLHLQALLFGPRANVFLVREGGPIAEAFQRDAELSGEPAPTPQPAPRVDTYEAFAARWRTDRKTTVKAVTAALPLFDRTLAAEVVHRAGAPARAADCDTAMQQRLFGAAQALRAAILRPRPCIYWQDRFAETFSLTPLQHLAALREERFDAVDEAARVYVRRRLGEQRFRAVYAPLEKALAAAHNHLHRSAERMLDELAKESRADRYERWGHLLMAAPEAARPGAEQVALPDLFEEGRTVTIPLDPALSAVENAQRYYDRARRTRQARGHAETRLIETEQRAEAAGALLAQLRAIETYRDLERFKKDEAAALSGFVGQAADVEDGVPFRRYPLEGGFEVWVGKNARQNDLLTFRYAQKYDLWMHARGVAGSHAVLRRPGRTTEPSRPLLERAASIAAYHSKARGSSLVPVMVTERKYVRKPKGAPPGAVVVEHEEVLLVPPGLPDGS